MTLNFNLGLVLIAWEFFQRISVQPHLHFCKCMQNVTPTPCGSHHDTSPRVLGEGLFKIALEFGINAILQEFLTGMGSA